MNVTRREIIAASIGAGLLTRQALAQQAQGGGGTQKAPPPPVRKGKITKLFKTPEGYPNAMAAAPEGWWVGEQKSNNACLLDHEGKLLKTVPTEAKNTSGIAFGGGSVWMCANAAPFGIFQIDAKSGSAKRCELPLGGGGCHGAVYIDGKIWFAALRLKGILRVDAKTWEPEYLLPYDLPRAHGVAWDNGSIWMVTGGPDGAGLIKYDASNGRILETVKFDELYPDPHGLAVVGGTLYTCDAGLHPGWPDNKSTASGYICRIEIA